MRRWAAAMLKDWWRGSFVVARGGRRESGLGWRHWRVFGIQVAEVEEAGDRSANIRGLLIVNVLEIFAVILLVDHPINVLMSEELEDEW